MKNPQQNLLMILAISLCALCTCQWYGQTLQRDRIQRLNRLVYEKSVVIRDCTNSIATLNHQIGRMDASLTELKDTIRTNAEVIADQKRELVRLQAVNEGLTNEIAQYKEAVETMTAKLKEAYEGIKKQNDSIKELVVQRDEFVKKYNDSMKERNDIVAQYNELAAQIQKLQGTKQ